VGRRPSTKTKVFGDPTRTNVPAWPTRQKKIGVDGSKEEGHETTQGKKINISPPTEKYPNKGRGNEKNTGGYEAKRVRSKTTTRTKRPRDSKSPR